jgi:hypothetical protein
MPVPGRGLGLTLQMMQLVIEWSPLPAGGPDECAYSPLRSLMNPHIHPEPKVDHER